MDRLYLARDGGLPVVVTIAVPFQIGRDTTQITGAHVQSTGSMIVANVTLHDLANPDLSGQINAHIGIKDAARVVSLPLYLSGRGGTTGRCFHLGSNWPQHDLYTECFG